jgi:hypothetical protein
MGAPIRPSPINPTFGFISTSYESGMENAATKEAYCTQTRAN